MMARVQVNSELRPVQGTKRSDSESRSLQWPQLELEVTVPVRARSRNVT
jgi:hypothetical protein